MRRAGGHAGRRVGGGLAGVPTALLVLADAVVAEPSAVPIDSRLASWSYTAVDEAIEMTC